MTFLSLYHLNPNLHTYFSNFEFMNVKEKILVIGSQGQIGIELVARLRQVYGEDNVLASDVKEIARVDQRHTGLYETLNVLNANRLHEVVKTHQITEVYLLAALLSATAEKDPAFAWDLNMNGLFNVLNLAKEGIISKIYWPSSIAVFGPTTPKKNTPQFTIMEPSTVYGISKQAGERWCEYYVNKFKVDVRSLRYPGLIGWKSAPGGGTTDYAVHIFHEALKTGSYSCFLAENTELPMMYMPDAIKATIDIMQAEASKISIRSAYNLSGFSFSPKELADEIRKHLPGLSITYKPDFRQAIADSWPQSIDDSRARLDWGWKPEYNLTRMCSDMLLNLGKQKKQKS
jgi:nucleoside-diphosphate-sugar epimerase